MNKEIEIALSRIATAITADAAGSCTSNGAYVASLTEAVMSVSDSLMSISNSLLEVARAIEESGNNKHD